MAEENQKQHEIVEIWHSQLLAPLQSYEVASPSGDLFDPTKAGSDFTEVFQKVLQFWSQMHAESGSTILDYAIVPNPVFKSKMRSHHDHSVRALVTLYKPDSKESVYRRVHSLEGVLDVHCSLANEFTECHPDIGFWCYPEQSQSNWWAAPPKPLEKPNPDEWMHEWIALCKKRPHLRAQLDPMYLDDDDDDEN